MSDGAAKKKNLLLILTQVLLLGGYGILCAYLYYKQTLKLPNYLYESDLPYHIEMALDGWGYSLTAIIYRFLHMFPYANVTIALFLSLCTIGTIFVTVKAVDYYLHKPWISLAVGMFSGFVMPFFIRAVQYSRYNGYQSGSIWHNSTYIVMKLFALGAFFLYCVIAGRYGKKFGWKDWVFFAGLLVLTTATKTSFLLVFAPAAFLMLLVDLYLKIPLKKVLLVATTVIPSLVVVLLQQTVLFGEDTGNGIAIDFAYSVYLTTGRPYLTMPLSVLFPLIVLFANFLPVFKDTLADFKERKGSLRHREYFTTWLVWFFGFAEYLLLRETGSRSGDGNFSWGYDFCIFLLFIWSMIYFYRNMTDGKFGPKPVRIVYGVLAGGVLLYHVYCGIYYFALIIQGYTYFL